MSVKTAYHVPGEVVLLSLKKKMSHFLKCVVAVMYDDPAHSPSGYQISKI